MDSNTLVADLQQRFADGISIKVAQEQITAELAPGDLYKYCQILRSSAAFQFNLLLDICAVDYLHYGKDEWATSTATSEGFSRASQHIDRELQTIPDHPVSWPSARFAVVYHLLSTALNHRLRLKVFVPGEPPRVPTVTGIWPAANWYEREAFDLFGILFDDHPDLRRILTDYGFIGHPFRKDFPLIGQVEMRYDATEQRVVYEPVSIKARTLVPKVIRYVGQEEDA